MTGPADDVVAALAEARAEIARLNAQRDKLAEAVKVHRTFAEKVAEAMDIDLDETKLAICVQPSGREIPKANMTWAEAIALGDAALRDAREGR